MTDHQPTHTYADKPPPFISSAQNPMVQQLKRLVSDPTAYREQGVVLMG